MKIYQSITMLIVVATSMLLTSPVFSQFSKKEVSYKDSLDGAIDLSDYLIHAHGILPVPYIITEPALGGFGGAIIPVYLQKRPAYIDSINGQVKITPIAPDITGGLALYTANGTWATAAFRQGTLLKSRIKYIIGGAYANVFMSYYKTFPQFGEKEFAFQIKTVPLFVQGIKRIGYSHWYGGLKYLFLKTDVYATGDSGLPANFAKPREYSSTVSQLGGVIELDSRDNIFTPDNGIKFHVDAIRSDEFLGSDFEYWRVNYFSYLYKQLDEKVVGGLRIDGRQVFQDPPFFMYPYVELRGVPVNRYRGKASILTEAEFRWDFFKRWSVLFYSGVGKAFDKWNEFNDAKLVYNYGTGFRYLIARKFKLRMGLDFARGPEDFAYYIVFGSSWIK
ncbi:MAG TPA: hypothetical protein VLC28_16580 [Flavitalea sp.]|nr:hypothetical protein [Flavitalea sp.]